MSTATLGPRHILIGVTGSVAAIKLPKLIQDLKAFITQQQDIEIRVVSTQNGLHFFKPSDILTHAELFTDDLEWQSWKRISDPVLHIDLRNWADLILIAPLDANTLGKVANGLCDNLLTCILRAWDPLKPCIVCPAMNTYMWNHPLTEKHLDVLKNTLQYQIIAPISKTLACGDVGIGAMAETQDIAQFVHKTLELK